MLQKKLLAYDKDDLDSVLAVLRRLRTLTGAPIRVVVGGSDARTRDAELGGS